MVLVLVLVLMIYQKHMVPQYVCMMLAMMALLTAKYSIKSGFGILEGTYSLTEAQPTHRPGQGSQVASALWMIVSCICFSTMLKLCQHRVSFCDPRNKLTNRQTSDGLKCNTLVLPRNPPQSPQRSNNHGNSYLGPQAENLNSQNA